MDKEKLSAARKKLKEYQKNKKEHQTNQQNETVKDMKLTEETMIRNDSPGNVVQNHQQDFVQSNMECSSSDDISNINTVHFENNYQTPAINHMFNTSECQTSSQDPFAQADYDNHIKTTGITNENNIVTIPNHEIPQNEGQMQSVFQSVKDSFAVQKEQMLQISSAIQNVLEDKNKTGNDHDEFYHQNRVFQNVVDNKMTIDPLQEQVKHYENRIKELENTLANKEATLQEKFSREINHLQEQLQAHIHTTNILVAEKAELTSLINQNQVISQQKNDEVKDVSEKFKMSQVRISELEKELQFTRSNNNDVQKTCRQLQTRYDDLSNQFSELRKTKDDIELESSELKQKLSVKNTELTNLQQELQEKIALLSLSELKIQQLTNSPQESQMMDNQRNVVAVYEQQIAQLKDTIKSLTDEKSDAGKQYKSYVQQLDERYNQASKELEIANKRIAEFESREESYIQRLSDMELQLQKENKKVESSAPTEDYETRINILTKNIDNLVLEQESLQTALNYKDAEIEDLKNKLQELEKTKGEEVDTSKLLHALESEQLGAARAVSQNQQLKNQLNEMHNAFVSLSNDKLDLTEQIQAERSVGKKLNMMLNEVEVQLEEVKNQLREKEAALKEFEKDKLRFAQIEDQIQHYQAQSHQAGTIQQELTKALSTIEILTKENEDLREKVNAQVHAVANLEKPLDLDQQQINNENSLQVKNLFDEKSNGNDARSRKISTETQTSTQVDDEESFYIPEPLKKLEVKFKYTMEQVAELTDEKQRLEHLVMQLQGETETIGEYIALYQKQRSILHERAREKERSFKELMEQKNQLQEQLHKLKLLVTDFINNKTKSSLSNYPAVNGEQDPVEKHFDVTDKPTIIEPPSVEINVKDKTTADILDLLTEIKDCNDSCNNGTDFHPCPWCSGKLMTV